jgi:hypothetical protein
MEAEKQEIDLHGHACRRFVIFGSHIYKRFGGDRFVVYQETLTDI